VCIKGKWWAEQCGGIGQLWPTPNSIYNWQKGEEGDGGGTFYLAIPSGKDPKKRQKVVTL